MDHIIEMCHWYRGYKLHCWKGMYLGLKCHSVNKCICYKPSDNKNYDYSEFSKPPKYIGDKK